MFCKCEEKKHIFQYLEHQLDLVSCYYFNLMNKLYTVVAFYILKLTAYNNNINLSLGFIISLKSYIIVIFNIFYVMYGTQ